MAQQHANMLFFPLQEYCTIQSKKSCVWGVKWTCLLNKAVVLRVVASSVAEIVKGIRRKSYKDVLTEQFKKLVPLFFISVAKSEKRCDYTEPCLNHCSPFSFSVSSSHVLPHVQAIVRFMRKEWYFTALFLFSLVPLLYAFTFLCVERHGSTSGEFLISMKIQWKQWLEHTRFQGNTRYRYKGYRHGAHTEDKFTILFQILRDVFLLLCLKLW